MHVVILVDPEIPVPPRLYGGIERVVAQLVDELQDRGHRVTLFAHPESTAPCRLVGWRGRSSQSRADTLRNAAQLGAELRRLDPRDVVVHSFARLAYLTAWLPRRLAVVQSYQRAVTPQSVALGHALSRGRLQFTACSARCAASGDVMGHWHVVYNSVDLDKYEPTMEVDTDAPLVFLGRVERIKGPHHAVEVARRSGRRLVIAGNLPETGPDAAFARDLVAGLDGDRARYVGPVDDQQKNELLGRAAALLMPIEWEEPFGIVMAEALACGTPVLGLARGSVPEVVDHGRTGFISHDVDEMVGHVGRIAELNRIACRETARQRFSSAVMTDGFLGVYRAALRAQRLPTRLEATAS
jgi:glycosyltransferase involved in cell wall biosynthesis